MKKVIILSGIPGCGKSTWSNREYPDAVVCSADHFHMVDGEYQFNRANIAIAHSVCMQRFLRALRCGDGPRAIVVDNTNIHFWERQNYVTAAKMMGFHVEVHAWQCYTFKKALRCHKRNVHGVPLDVVLKMAAEFDKRDCGEDRTVEHSIPRV